jgi:hypothetical protein
MDASLHKNVGGLLLLMRNYWKKPILDPLFHGKNNKTQTHKNNF